VAYARRLAKSKQLIAQETGRNPDTSQVGLGLTDRRPSVFAAFSDTIVIIPIKLIAPVRKLSDATTLTIPWCDVSLVKRRAGLGYTGFDLALPAATLRTDVANQWRDLIKDLNARAATPAE